MPLRSLAMKWNGVSYIGERGAHVAVLLAVGPAGAVPAVQADAHGDHAQFDAASVRIMFWFGPCVCWVETLMPTFSVSSAAITPP
jgi:hypothetical protein